MKRTFLLMAALALPFAAIRTGAQEARLTPLKLQTALQGEMKGADADKLAADIRGWIGADKLKQGANAKVDGLTTAWAIEAPGAKSVKIALNHGEAEQDLIRIGKTDVYALAMTLPDTRAFQWQYDVDGKQFGGGNLEVYTRQAEDYPIPGVPKGKVTQQPNWNSKIFPNTERKWWIYVPAQYTADKPACVMIVQDGEWYLDITPTVMDNLIAKGDMPVTVAIFVKPGDMIGGAKSPERGERNFEYDTLSDQYARFLLEEILPEAEKTVKLRHDAASRMLAGISSGGIASFTAAWQRPDQFSKVLSWVGSYTGLAINSLHGQTGNDYPVLIRQSPAKPIRVFLQDGENDLDNEFGNWPLQAQSMAKALAYKKVRLQFRVRSRLPQRQSRQSDYAGIAAVAVEGVQGRITGVGYRVSANTFVFWKFTHTLRRCKSITSCRIGRSKRRLCEKPGGNTFTAPKRAGHCSNTRHPTPDTLLPKEDLL